MRRHLAAAVLVLGAAQLSGCQSYNFGPVSSCLIQPGQRQISLAAVEAADVLFVVDDSGSTEPKQQALAQSFASFIEAIAAAQKDRVSRNLAPFEFHLAVTTSSVFRNYSLGNTGFSTRYESMLNPGCTKGVAAASGPYPQGDFVAAGANARVLHFTKGLNWASWGTASPDPALVSLVQQFVGTNGGGTYSGGNIEVGSCGSAMEQHLRAGRMALQKALAGQQPGVAVSDFPHLGSKLVVVVVGDEDDCSSNSEDPLLLTGDPGNDSCVADRYLAADRKLIPVSEFADYLTGLVTPAGQAPTPARPYISLGAAFIASAARCSDGTYTPADTCSPVTPPGTRVDPGVCPYPNPVTAPVCGGTAPTVPACAGAFGAGVRFFELADIIRSSGYDVVQGSVCEPFGPILAAIGELVKAPLGLRLPTVPASNEVAILRILDAKGASVKVCPQARTGAEAATSGWWFMDCNDRGVTPLVSATPTSCVYINHSSGACEANPGESYTALYLGEVPAGGCTNPTSDGTTPSADCAAKLGGGATKWSCYRPADAVTGNGSCICL